MPDAMPSDIDVLIDEAHQAAQTAESEAQQILQRIRRIPGCNDWNRRNRPFGTFANPWAPNTSNLSVQSAILRADAPLAHYLASKAGTSLPSNEARAEAEAKRQESINRLNSEIEQMRQRNRAVAARHEQERTYGRFDVLRGRVI